MGHTTPDEWKETQVHFLQVRLDKILAPRSVLVQCIEAKKVSAIARGSGHYGYLDYVVPQTKIALSLCLG